MVDKLFGIIGDAVSSFPGSNGGINVDLVLEGNPERLYGKYCNVNVILVLKNRSLEQVDGLKSHVEKRLISASMSEVNIFVQQACCN